jgi:hypothetical protein
MEGGGNGSDYDDGRRTFDLFSMAPPASGSGGNHPNAASPAFRSGAAPGFGAGAYPPYAYAEGASASGGQHRYSYGAGGSGSGGQHPFGYAAGAAGSGGCNPYSVPPPYSAATASHLGFSGLNLNASSYPDMDDYEGILRFGEHHGEVRGGADVDTAPVAPVARGRRRASRARGLRRSSVNISSQVPVLFLHSHPKMLHAPSFYISTASLLFMQVELLPVGVLIVFQSGINLVCANFSRFCIMVMFYVTHSSII